MFLLWLYSGASRAEAIYVFCMCILYFRFRRALRPESSAWRIFLIATRQCDACWQYPQKKRLDGNDIVAASFQNSKQVRLCSSMNVLVWLEAFRRVTNAGT